MTDQASDRQPFGVSGGSRGRIKYHKTFRRMLLDMHIPDWDPEFLARFDPETLADAYVAAGATGVMLYCKSHIGLNYWPSPIGGIHAAARDRDLVGELRDALVSRGIAPAAYHTVVFDNWAVENHPDWGVVHAPSLKGVDRPWFGPRYGTASPTNREYVEYEKQQLVALLRRYDFDALFLDMTFWSGVSVDQASRDRYREELGLEIPTTLDWTNPEWVSFQRARERWVLEFIDELIQTARAVRPGLAITHNMAPGTFGWYSAQNIDFSNRDTFASGDIYGGRDEQLLVSKLMLHLGAEQPAEFMTTRTANLDNHVELKSRHMMTVEALATIAHGGAMLFIDAIDPRGTINRGVYERVGEVFSQISEFEDHLGGEPIEDVAIYYSDASRILPQDSGKDLADIGLDVSPRLTPRKDDLPHLRAANRASVHLQRAHIPFGLITRDGLHRLKDYRVVVLADVLMMDEAEMAAIRRFVEEGGSAYISGRTSLLGSDGTAFDDFGLSDVIGAHVERREDGDGIFLKAQSGLVSLAIEPELHLGFGFKPFMVGAGLSPHLALPRLSAKTDAFVHATLNVPYGYPSSGSIEGRDFASIHSSPPWLDLTNPTIIENSYGQGRVIYSVAPLEVSTSAADERLFVAMISSLLADQASYSADAHPDLWITAFDQPTAARSVFCILAYTAEDLLPASEVSLRWPPRAGEVVTCVRELPSGKQLAHSVGEDGMINLTIDRFSLFGMFALEYQKVGVAAT